MKKAVILLNLGGPDKPQSVKPFLFNLFNDKAIIGLPQPFRFLLAKFISSRRNKTAQEIYSHIGGKSPLLELTTEQAKSLENELGDGWKVFICMRYWHPMSAEIVKKVKEFAPEEIILLPLYPQFSTTTTESSFADWHKQAEAQKLEVPTKEICCYPTEENLIRAHVELIKPQIEAHPDARVLFSAHGLPLKVVEKGDPYPQLVESTAHAVAEKLQLKDWRVCYQSKVGPLPWLKPNTEDEIKQAGADGKDIIITPIAFVSEHSETLVELDIEFAEIAEHAGVENYIRIPALGTNKNFINGLAKLCQNSRYANSCCPEDDDSCVK
ncbi:MAG: ferrochelatase [Alphaproteobacteria bacterium CG11_big_fil_rev_8_21_14_0_20_44_7]|nr:MAG: ferrochelatase [Alphaproteobacteria bacterium CG11_big_fil_rev_8_21_14_0_20_44_7]